MKRLKIKMIVKTIYQINICYPKYNISKIIIEYVETNRMKGGEDIKYVMFFSPIKLIVFCSSIDHIKVLFLNLVF